MDGDLTFLHCDHRPGCVASVDKHFDYHTLQLMTRGGVRLSYGEQVHELHDAWTWPTYPGPRIRFHEWPRGQAWHHRYVAFTGPRVVQWRSAGLLPSDPQPVLATDVVSLAELFDALIAQVRRPGQWAQLRAANLLEHVLLRLAEARTARPPDRARWLEDVMEELADVGRDLDYGELAGRHSLSLATLRRHFRAATGASPHAYRVACRIAEARRRLGDTDAPIKQIAQDLGYRDVYYFTRQFTRETGVSPGLFRRSRQK